MLEERASEGKVDAQHGCEGFAQVPDCPCWREGMAEGLVFILGCCEDLIGWLVALVIRNRLGGHEGGKTERERSKEHGGENERTVNTPMKNIPPRTIFFSSGILTLKTRGRGMSTIMTSDDMFRAALVIKWLIIAEH